MKRRLLAVLAAGIMIFSFTAYSGSTTTKQSTEDAKTQKKKLLQKSRQKSLF